MTPVKVPVIGFGGGQGLGEPSRNRSNAGGVALAAIGARLLHLHHHRLHGDLLLAVAAVQLFVVLGGIRIALGARASRHGAEGVSAGGGQGAQQRGALRHLVLLGAAVALLRVRIGVAVRRDHFLLAHRTRLLGFGQPRVHTSAVVGWRGQRQSGAQLQPPLHQAAGKNATRSRMLATHHENTAGRAVCPRPRIRPGKWRRRHSCPLDEKTPLLLIPSRKRLRAL